MSSLLRGLALVTMWAGIMVMQFNFDLDMSTTRKLKNGLELAVHDAALALNQQELGQGRIVFDQATAFDNINKSLQDNLQLDGLHKPLPNTFFHNQVRVLHVEFIDDYSGVEFPMNYSNSTFNVLETIHGPGIIIIAETESPRFFRGDSMKIRQAVVYEYYRR
ncbi:peptidase M23 [Sutcliffiella horikoshii]|uniref:peptidase M23 n=1 Tax=Sutcliffiella horikoshii TaxID=79883 RepID=UPI001CBD3038|nr:peptidase M23 [Sutcliffiella horikoshii]MCM3619742.1 peptidase M23 [Sutcliffiella horikoshii]UAL49885.1 peptidase M23 [Sutcliffiella horikoshii]